MNIISTLYSAPSDNNGVLLYARMQLSVREVQIISSGGMHLNNTNKLSTTQQQVYLDVLKTYTDMTLAKAKTVECGCSVSELTLLRDFAACSLRIEKSYNQSNNFSLVKDLNTILSQNG